MKRSLELLVTVGAVAVVTSLGLGTTALLAERRKRPVPGAPQPRAHAMHAAHATKGARRSFVAEVARSVAVTLVAAAIATPARRLLVQWIEHRTAHAA